MNEGLFPREHPIDRRQSRQTGVRVSRCPVLGPGSSSTIGAANDAIPAPAVYPRFLPTNLYWKTVISFM